MYICILHCRLDDILEEDENEGNTGNNKISTLEASQKKRSVSFADSDDAETLEIIFTHSNIEPSTDSYKPEVGITKPSDIYEAYSNLFTHQNSSILKKSKYKDRTYHDQVNNNVVEVNNITQASPTEESDTQSEKNVNRTILINDIIEKTDDKKSNVEFDKRPVSLFKKRRQKQNS